MWLQSVTTELFRSECNPNSTSVHCVVHLEEDITEVLPYLNTALGGADCTKSPPTLTLKVDDKRITLHAREIFIGAVDTLADAETVLSWLKKKMNDTWADRENIQPSLEPAPAPKWIEILKLLPKTNCGKCGEPTCTVFALRTVEGAKRVADCPELSGEPKKKLEEYLSGFNLRV